jgi:hypothetical protein
MTEQRRIVGGRTDFTMMYVAHDAFTRDVNRFAAACERDDPFTPNTRAGWAMFAGQLHAHHTVEDTALWPRLRAQSLRADEVLVLDSMEMEHAAIDPHLERVEHAFADCDATELINGVQALRAGLTAHLRHEEEAALPLVDAYLGPAGWADFGREIRRTQGGLRGGATYLPWVLDGSSAEVQRRVLTMLPPPARVLYRRVWAPRYRRTGWWNATP